MRLFPIANTRLEQVAKSLRRGSTIGQPTIAHKVSNRLRSKGKHYKTYSDRFAYTGNHEST